LYFSIGIEDRSMLARILILIFISSSDSLNGAPEAADDL